MRTNRRSLQRLWISCFASLILPFDPQITAQDHALIKVRVDTAYNDSPSSLALVQALATYLPPRNETLLPGETISGFILRVYGVSTYDSSSASYLPKTYSIIQNSLLTLNKKTSPTVFQAGTILAPQIPKKSLEFFNASLTRNHVPYMMMFTKLGHSSAAFEAAVDTHAADFVSERTVPLSPRTTATQSTELYLPLTTTLSRHLLNNPILSTNSTALSFPLRIRLAALHSQPPPTHPQDHLVLSDSDHTAIRSLLSARGTRTVPLFVLDTGWPDSSTYLASRGTLRQMLAAIWTSHLGTAGPFPGFVDDAFVAPSNPHVSIVQRSLSEFQQLDQSKHVQVIYIPLTREQASTPLLICLLETSYLLQYQSEHSGVPLDPKIAKSARDNASLVVGQLPAVWNGEEIDTDKAVIDAVLRLGDAWSAQMSLGYVVNESWTVQHAQYFVYYSEPPQGIVIAAVGNDGLDINTQETDFAQRCSTTIDTLAVMNISQNGSLMCCSSHINQGFVAGAAPAMAAGFDGEVSGTGCDQACGTSFAAPRVAWIIAAGEAMRSGAFQPSLWGQQVKARVLAARGIGTSGWSSMWLNAVTYLSAQQ